LFSQTKQDNIFELSKRVGSDLDSVEIEYFNVFPEIDFVKSAVYRKDNFGNILLLLSFSNGRDSTVTISKMAGEELSRLIDGFESVADKEDLINWKLLPGFSPNRLNYFENTGRNITVNTKEGSFSGRILIVSDSSIFIWQKKGSFQPVDCDRFIKHFHFSQIKSIEIRPSISSKLFGASIGAGLAVGAIQRVITPAAINVVRPRTAKHQIIAGVVGEISPGKGIIEAKADGHARHCAFPCNLGQ
jgi:hypothetical protein